MQDHGFRFIAIVFPILRILPGANTGLENVVIQEFQENRCEVAIYNHIWRRSYFIVGHLKPIIEYSEYMELFETIWKDRAASAGWEIQFVYTDECTSLIFSRRGENYQEN